MKPTSLDFRKLCGAAAVLATVSMVDSQASAVTLTGQLDLTGTVDLTNSIFTPTGGVDFNDQTALAVIATGDFASVNTVFEAGDNTFFALNDIDFTSPGVIYDGGGFTFTASSFFGFDDTFPGLAFKALGIITAILPGPFTFDPTPGQFSLSLQGGAPVVSFSSTTTVVPLPASALLLLGGLGMLGGLGLFREPTPTTA